MRLVDSRERHSQESTKQLSAVLQAMVEGVLAVDGDERVLFANTATCTMLDRATAKLEGRTVIGNLVDNALKYTTKVARSA